VVPLRVVDDVAVDMQSRQGAVAIHADGEDRRPRAAVVADLNGDALDALAATEDGAAVPRGHVAVHLAEVRRQASHGGLPVVIVRAEERVALRAREEDVARVAVGIAAPETKRRPMGRPPESHVDLAALCWVAERGRSGWVRRRLLALIVRSVGRTVLEAQEARGARP
jgi:hypothetical protein